MCVSLSVLLFATAILWFLTEVAAPDEISKSHSRGRHITNPPLSRTLVSALLQAVISEIQLASSTPTPTLTRTKVIPE